MSWLISVYCLRIHVENLGVGGLIGARTVCSEVQVLQCFLPQDCAEHPGAGKGQVGTGQIACCTGDGLVVGRGQHGAGVPQSHRP